MQMAPHRLAQEANVELGNHLFSIAGFHFSLSGALTHICFVEDQNASLNTNNTMIYEYEMASGRM